MPNPLLSQSGVSVVRDIGDLPAAADQGIVYYVLATRQSFVRNGETWDEITPQTWVNGVRKTNVKTFHASGTVTNGSVTLYLTDDGTVGGNAVFTNVYSESLTVFVPSSSDTFVTSFVVAANKKSVTLTVNRLGTVILGIIQVITAANGTQVYLTVKGD